MIQSPQLNYTPAIRQMPAGILQTSQVPVQNPQQQNVQMPGVIYSYPQAGSYMPVTEKPIFNGVKFSIKNPQGQGQAGAGLDTPVRNTVQEYNGVSIDIINPQGQGLPAAGYPGAYMPYAMQQPAYSVYPGSNNQAMQPVYPVYPGQTNLVQQQMQPVYPGQPNTEPQPAVQIQPEIPAKQTAPDVPAPQTAPQIEVKPETAAPVPIKSEIDPIAFASRLQSGDLDEQKAAIEDTAEKIRNSGDDGAALLHTSVFNALIDILNKDTSSLPGPSPEVLELREKYEQAPENFSEADKAKIGPSPLEKAEINKLYSIYTISYMQERLNKELEKQNIGSLKLEELPYINTVIDTVKDNKNPMLRIGAISALSHIANPEYAQDLSAVFKEAAKDENAKVREAAIKAGQAIGMTDADFQDNGEMRQAA